MFIKDDLRPMSITSLIAKVMECFPMANIRDRIDFKSAIYFAKEIDNTSLCALKTIGHYFVLLLLVEFSS